MKILTQAIEKRIVQISKMGGTTSEIEHAIRLLCLAVAEDTMDTLHQQRMRTSQEIMSFESLAARTQAATSIESEV